MAVVETGTGIPCCLRHEAGSQSRGNLGPERSSSVGNIGEHIRLYLYLLAVDSHLVLKRDPFQGCSGRCVWIAKTRDEDDPVAVRERVVPVVFHQVEVVAKIKLANDMSQQELYKRTFASSPPRLPKLKPFPCLEGGLPPLAGGCGIGEGEV